jgi:hypothetical protein
MVWAYQGEKFSMEPPLERNEEVKLFGSDVMFTKKVASEGNPIFVKFLVQAEEISDFNQFLKEKALSAKSFTALNVVPEKVKTIKSKELYSMSFEVAGKESYIWVAILKKDTKSYLYLMLNENSKESLFLEKSRLLQSLQTVKFH